MENPGLINHIVSLACQSQDSQISSTIPQDSQRQCCKNVEAANLFRLYLRTGTVALLLNSIGHSIIEASLTPRKGT